MIRCALLVAACAVTVGCGHRTIRVGGGTPDIDAARAFDAHPLYWVGAHFEHWDLEHVEIGKSAFVTFSYGTCEL